MELSVDNGGCSDGGGGERTRVRDDEAIGEGVEGGREGV